MEGRLATLDETDRQDTGILTFEDLGIDKLYVDEAHYFKNLQTVTKLSNVGGIQVSPAQKNMGFPGNMVDNLANRAEVVRDHGVDNTRKQCQKFHP